MENGLVDLITNKDKNWNQRWKYNCAIFIISYTFMGAVTGITNDSYMSYLNLTVPEVVKAFPTYMSIATFILAIVLLFVHKFGYKKLILLAPIMTIAGFLVCIYSKSANLILIANIVLLIGVCMYDFMYPLMFTSYTPKEERTKMFARVMYCNLISQSIIGFVNGKIVVWKFAKSLHISYDKASLLSEHANKLNSSQLNAYIGGYKFVLWLGLILTVLSLCALLFLNERVEDYRETEEEMASRKAEKRFDFKLFANKYVIMWVVVVATIRFGALLVTPFFPIYLNNFLHISRGTVSTIITFQTLAMVLGFFATPVLEKKFGAIVTMGVTTILCIPLMLIMANGAMFGTNVAWIIGLVLFLRSGLANTSGPIQGSLPLTFVPKNLVPAYNSLILVVNSIVGIIAGQVAKNVLLKTDAGYGKAYYITSAFYLTACIVLLIVFTKKYNRSLDKNETKLKKEEVVSTN